jgi:aminoglycoside phosphotransferase (APT) family kinase protein
MGNARLTARLTLREGVDPRQVILRHDSGEGPFAGTVFSLEREALVCKALAGSGLPVPRVYASSSELSTMLTENMPGAHDAKGECLPALLACLRRLHEIDPANLDLPGFKPSIGEALATWQGIFARHVTVKSAVVELAFEQLERQQPAEPARIALCHGDPGYGNYLVSEQRISALLDWEMAQLGDPLDDLVWIAVRAVQFNVPLDNFAQLIATHYGITRELGLSPPRVAFWRAFGVLRMLIICLLAISKPRAGKERLVQHTMVAALEFQLLEALAQIAGRTLMTYLDAAPLRASAFPLALLSEAALDVDEVLVPRLSKEQVVSHQAKRIRNLLRDIANAVRQAGPQAMAEARSLEELAQTVAEKLRWLPSAAALARRPFPQLLQPRQP